MLSSQQSTPAVHYSSLELCEAALRDSVCEVEKHLDVISDSLPTGMVLAKVIADSTYPYLVRV